jgi:hypothetical protein
LGSSSRLADNPRAGKPGRYQFALHEPSLGRAEERGRSWLNI